MTFDQFEKFIQINKYNLIKIIRKPDNGAVRSYVAIITNHYGTEHIIKLFESPDAIAKARFVNEILNTRKIRGILPTRYKQFIPKILKYSLNGQNPYYIYEYFKGDPIGEFISTYGVDYGTFRHRNFNEFISFIDYIENLNIPNLQVSTWGSRVARKELQHYFENVKGLLPSDLYDKIETFFETHHTNITKATVYSHRDLYPENILSKSNQSTKFQFLDWEYFSNVPLGYNVAFLYLLLWREEYWKAKLFAHFYNKYESDKKLRAEFLRTFRFCLIMLGVRFLYQIETFGRADEDTTRHAKLSFLYDIGLALSGDIVKPRNIKFFVDLHDFQKVSDAYGLGKVKKFEVFYASKGNTVVKVVTSSGDFVFRFYSNSRSKTLIKRELKIFEKLKSVGIPTYQVTRTLDNKLFLEIDLYGKVRKVAVMTYVKGKKLQRTWARYEAIVQVGEMLRKIHDQNIVHGDYSKENVLFIKSKLSGVIDFEWGRFTKSKEAKIHDLAKTIALWLIDIRNKKISDTLCVDAIIKGYFKTKISTKDLDKLMQIAVQKIENERNIFLTTADIKIAKHSGKRFDESIEVVRTYSL